MKKYKQSLDSYIKTIKDETAIDITQKRRYKPLIDLLQIYCYRAYTHFPKLSYYEIGKSVNRHHATVLHHVKQYKNLYFSDAQFREQAEFYITRFCAIDGYSRNEPNKDELHKLIDLASESTRGVWLNLIQNTPIVKRALQIENTYELQPNE